MGTSYSVATEEIQEGDDKGLYRIISTYTPATEYEADDEGNITGFHHTSTMHENTNVDMFIGDGRNVYYRIINYKELTAVKDTIVNIQTDLTIYDINLFKIELVFKSIYPDINNDDVAYVKKHVKSKNVDFVLHNPTFIDSCIWWRCLSKYNPHHNNLEDINLDIIVNPAPEEFPYICDDTSTYEPSTDKIFTIKNRDTGEIIAEI